MKQAALLILAALAANSLYAQDVRVLIAYYSQTGNTKQLAEAVAAGVQSVEGAEATLRPIEQVTQPELESADAIVLGSPVHMGDVAAPVRKALVDWSSDFKFWQSRALTNKVGAVFATGHAPSNGKEFTMMSLALAMLQYGMVIVSPHGSLGASATTGIPETDKGINEYEISFAKSFGERIATVAAQMKRGLKPANMASIPQN